MTSRLLHIITAITAAMLFGALPLGVNAAEDPAPRVSLLVCDPGKQIYELEGHAALRLDYTESGGEDVTVNWGLFDFSSPGFVYRFVKGETDYMAGAVPTGHFLRSYAAEGRGIREYPLEMTPEQARRLAEAVSVNLRPENRTYRYNYILDNCATRPLAMVEQALGRPVIPDRDSVGEGDLTFRKEMRRYHVNYPWYQFGIDLALGSRIDRPENGRAMVFAPVALGDMLTAAGHAERRLLYASPEGGPDGPTPWPLSPNPVCWTLFAITLLITISDFIRGHIGRASRVYDSLLYGIYGLAGCVVCYLIFVSVHEATTPNWVGLWLNPAALLVPALTWLKKAKKILNSYQIANFGALIALLAIWGFGLQQLNDAFLPLILMDMLRAGAYIKLDR